MMTNDELNKPRKFEIFYSGLAGTFSVRNNYSAFIMNIQKRQTDEYIHVIELAPMLKMMEEMAEALEFYSSGGHIEEHGGSNYTPDGSCCLHYEMPETVSGEPINYLEGHGDYGFEDGSIARIKIESYQAFKRENGLE